MAQRRSLNSLVLCGALTAAAGFALFSPSRAYAGDDCSKLKDAALKKTCEKDGVKGVKDAMKEVVKKAKSKDYKIDGKTVNCKSCHSDTKTYAKKDNAADDYKKIKAL